MYVVFFMVLASFFYLIKKIKNQIEYHDALSSIFTGIGKYVIIFSFILFVSVMLFELITNFMNVKFDSKIFLIAEIIVCGFLFLLFYGINSIIDKDFNIFIKNNTNYQTALQNKMNQENPLISFIKIHMSYFLYKINPYYQIPIIYDKLFKKNTKPDENVKNQEYMFSVSKFLSISITLLYAIILDILYENFGLKKYRIAMAEKWKNKMKNKLKKTNLTNELNNLLHKVFITI